MVAIGSNDIGGAVRGPAGSEAWRMGIAETTELPTIFAKIVTDDQVRFVIPDYASHPLTMLRIPLPARILR